MSNKVSIIDTIPFAGVTQNSFSKNSYEQRVLKDFVQTKRMSAIQFKNDIVAK